MISSNTEYNLSVFCVQLSESLTENTVPFDATSETPLEDQKTEAMVRVQDALLSRLAPEALGLLRAARSGRPLTPQTNRTFVFIAVFTIFLSSSERCGRRETCLVLLMWNPRRSWNSLSRSCMPTCQVCFVLFCFFKFVFTRLFCITDYMHGFRVFTS